MINTKRLPPLAIFLAFLLLCISVAYWAMQLFKPPVRNVVAPISVERTDAPLAAAAGLFGGGSGGLVAASNFQLKGVVVAANARESVAIIAADGKPAQAVWINGELQPGVTVKEVHRQYVLLSEGGVTRRVELLKNAGALTDIAVPVQPVPTGMGNDVNPGMQQQAPPPAPSSLSPANIGPGTGPRPSN
jgi:general secretion pathway protein C